MKKSIYITLITCGSLLIIPTACSQTQTSKHNQSTLAAEEETSSIQQTASVQKTASAIAVKVKVGSSSGSGVLIAQTGNTYISACKLSSDEISTANPCFRYRAFQWCNSKHCST